MGRRHEGRRLLVARQHQLDPGSSQRFDEFQVLFAGNAENAIDTFALKRCDKKIGACGHDVIAAWVHQTRPSSRLAASV
jgi:hypothetical protein